jgi:hypothetical protein
VRPFNLERSIARLAEGAICRGSQLVWHDSGFIEPQRVEPICIPGVASIRAPDLPRFISTDMRESHNAECDAPPASLLTSHLRRQPLGDHLQLGLDLSLTLVQHIQFQLITMKLD